MPSRRPLVVGDTFAYQELSSSDVLPLQTLQFGTIQRRTSNYTAVAFDRIETDTSTASFTITLPASPSDGDLIEIYDGVGSWFTNNLTIARNGRNIGGLAEDLICDVNFGGFILRYHNASTNWRLLV